MSCAAVSPSEGMSNPESAEKSNAEKKELIAGDPNQFARWFQEQFPHIPFRSALVVLQLASENATVPFIARYRKEQTGNLDEVAIGSVIDARDKWNTLVERKAFILGEIESQGKLTDELRSQIETTFDLLVLEDLYLPYKRKRKTKAAIAREAGLEPLAEWIWGCAHGEPFDPNEKIEERASSFVNVEGGVADVQAAIAGAQAILIERLSEFVDLRQEVREELFKHGMLTSGKGKDVKNPSKFDRYFEYKETIESLQKKESSHRYLALRRGETEGELALSIGSAPENESLIAGLQKRYEQRACPVKNSPGEKVLLLAAQLAFKVYVLISIESEIHATLKSAADVAAIDVFSENVRKVLLAPPLGGKCVLGVDPGLRTGCKLALVSASGDYIASGVIHLLSPDQQRQSLDQLTKMFETAGIAAIAVGNGTAARETEKFLREAVAKAGKKIPVVMVSESGASIYSASETAREEFPDLDLTVRGAISIARRLQDPLAELVKVDPKSIGVGQYQHDVSQSSLRNALERVVESCVNSVGVNINTASKHLLAYVSGIGPSLARAIVDHRASKGPFKSRTDLLSIPRFGERVFEQAAGFLRIPDGENPLDNTGVHPERYKDLEEFAQKKGSKVSEFLGSGVSMLKQSIELKEMLGEFTFNDVIQELEKPGRDPRSAFEVMNYRDDVHELADLKLGMMCPGVVTNVTNFGAFVDIGVHQDGLVHISQLSDSFVKDPRAVVNPGDRVMVRILEVNLEKRQIALSMKRESDAPRPSQPRSGNPSQSRGNQPNRSGDRGKAPANTPFATLGSILAAKMQGSRGEK